MSNNVEECQELYKKSRNVTKSLEITRNVEKSNINFNKLQDFFRNV